MQIKQVVKRVKPGLYCIMRDGFTIGSVGRDPNLQAKPGSWYVWTIKNQTAEGIATKEQALKVLSALIDE